MSKRFSPLAIYLHEFNKSSEVVRFSALAGWTSLSKEKLKSTRKAMKLYRAEHPCCELSGSCKKVQIHHIIPVWANPELADDPNNFIALSSSAHIHHIFGHDRNFARKYVSNIREISEKIHSIKDQMEVVNREDVSISSTRGIKEKFKSFICNILYRFYRY